MCDWYYLLGKKTISYSYFIVMKLITNLMIKI